MDAPDPEVGHPHAVGHRVVGEPLDHLHPEAVVALEHVPDPGHQHSPAHRRGPADPVSGSTSSGWKNR